jgi:hypothetical protein
VEIRNLFNPAFCGLTLGRAFSGFQEINSHGMPFSLTLLVLPLCFHKQSREVIYANKWSYLLKVFEENPQIRIDFATRTREMHPFTLEGLGLLMQLGCIEVSKTGTIVLQNKTVRKKVTGTPENISIQRTARFVGKGFAEIADRVTIYTSLGVRP